MTSYQYVCSHCDASVTEEAPIGTARRMRKCACGHVARLKLGVGLYIANTQPHVAGRERAEKQLSKDLPAYRRMRDRGLQPAQIDGCAQLENKVGDQFQIDYHKALEHGSEQKVLDVVQTLNDGKVVNVRG